MALGTSLFAPLPSTALAGARKAAGTSNEGLVAGQSLNLLMVRERCPGHAGVSEVLAWDPSTHPGSASTAETDSRLRARTSEAQGSAAGHSPESVDHAAAAPCLLMFARGGDLCASLYRAFLQSKRELRSTQAPAVVSDPLTTRQPPVTTQPPVTPQPAAVALSAVGSIAEHAAHKLASFVQVSSPPKTLSASPRPLLHPTSTPPLDLPTPPPLNKPSTSRLHLFRIQLSCAHACPRRPSCTPIVSMSTCKSSWTSYPRPLVTWRCWQSERMPRASAMAAASRPANKASARLPAPTSTRMSRSFSEQVGWACMGAFWACVQTLRGGLTERRVWLFMSSTLGRYDYERAVSGLGGGAELYDSQSVKLLPIGVGPSTM